MMEKANDLKIDPKLAVGKPILELTDVWKIYDKGQTQVHALKGITLTIQEGENIALVGPSGAGKTTLLYILGLMDLPTKGSFTLLGSNPLILSDNERSKLRGQKMGFVFQNFNLLPQLKAWENVALPLKYAGISLTKRKIQALQMLENVGLAERAEHYPSELSGGQEQRVAIARALVINPKLILADEPTGNLDSTTSQQILQLLETIHNQGTTLVTVTHSPNVAAWAKRVINIVDGQVSL
jgi:putative ABC transport system ATP-binding protein